MADDVVMERSTALKARLGVEVESAANQFQYDPSQPLHIAPKLGLEETSTKSNS
jgi:hypothetical protein